MRYTYGKTGTAIREAETESGRVRGLPGNNRNFTVFKGIPYAAPPVGELRWRPPQPAPKWDGVRECYHFSKDPVNFFPPFLGRNTDDSNESEDCLYLNVWTPATSPDEKLPVLVWIYGGGMMGGSSASSVYDGEGFCKRGVILVTFNYRTGALGLLAHPELSKESGYGSSGNYYFMDQMAAIKWTKRNIANFGGDPDKITIFGHSSGAIAVTGICTSPFSKGDFIGAGIQSSSVLRDFDGVGEIFLALDKAEERGVDFVNRCGFSSISEMRNASTAILKKTFWEWPLGRHAFCGTVDGYVFPDSPVHAWYTGAAHDIGYLCGTAEDEENSLYGFPGVVNYLTREMLPEYAKNFEDKKDDFLKFCEGLNDYDILTGKTLNGTMRNMQLAENQLRHGRKPAYLFCFRRRLPGDNAGAPHGAENPYIFQTLQNSWRPYTGADYELSDILADYWANFAKKGDPNGPEIPEWTPYTKDDKRVLMINMPPYMSERPLPKIQQYKLNYFLTTDNAYSYV